MAIIRIIDQPVLPGAPNYVQELQRQPVRTYREILGADYQPLGPGTLPHVAIPYVFNVDAGFAVTVAIPHGLNKVPGVPVDTDVDTHKRIPDVVIPMRVHHINGPVYDLTSGLAITLAYNDVIDPLLWTNGFYADEDNVYLTLINRTQAQARILFLVYIEFTHSVIGDEFYTTAQDTATIYTEDLTPRP